MHIIIFLRGNQKLWKPYCPQSQISVCFAEASWRFCQISCVPKFSDHFARILWVLCVLQGFNNFFPGFSGGFAGFLLVLQGFWKGRPPEPLERPNFCGFYWFYQWFSSGFVRFLWVLWVFIGFLKDLSYVYGFCCLHRGFLKVLADFYGFCGFYRGFLRVVPNFYGFCWFDRGFLKVLSDFCGFYRFHRSFLRFARFLWVL